MTEVLQRIDAFPFEEPVHAIERVEALLLADPLPSPMKRLRDHPPIGVIHFGDRYVEQAFAPPRGVYETADLRVEWQNMNGRQPFYHRNCGVDELSYQVCGERTVLTELGCLELASGEFSRIPDGIAHDNFGRQDVHLLFYIPASVTEQVDAARASAFMEVPFPGWKPVIINELTTERAGGPGQDLMLAPVDEALLLQHAQTDQRQLQVLSPSGEGLQWLYRSDAAALGRVSARQSGGTVYTMHRNADEIQYQVSGERLLVTQRGAVRLQAGDFVQVPAGVAFTSIHSQASEHLVLATRHHIPAVTDFARHGVRMSGDELAAARAGIGR
jgi:mannose-6-phosphate isomerase-like protein (cupin superfamily)